MFGTLRKLS